MSRVRNDPSFSYSENSSLPTKSARSTTSASETHISTSVTAKSEISSDSKDNTPLCAIYGTSHRLTSAAHLMRNRYRIEKTYWKKKDCVWNVVTAHKSRHCKEKLECSLCNSDKQVTTMHGDTPPEVHSGENTFQSTTQTSRTLPNPLMIESLCTQICGNSTFEKSCAKILPVFVYPKKIQTTV
jgi:hypothetical protein